MSGFISDVNIFVSGEKMIVRYKPTSLLITPKAMQRLSQRHDNELTHLGLEAIRRTVECGQNKLNFVQKLQNLFTPRSNLSVVLDANNHNFFLTAVRRFNSKVFKGWTEPINLEQAAMDKSIVDKTFKKSKEGILQEIRYHNGERHFFEI